MNTNRWLRGALVVLLVVGASVTAATALGSNGERRAGPVQISILSEDVPASLDFDGTSSGAPPTQTGMYNLGEQLLGYAKGGLNDDGTIVPNYKGFEPRLATSWSFNPKTLTWTFKLRKGVVGCDGQKFNADDVVYSFGRAKSVSGPFPLGWFLAKIASIKGFNDDVFAKDPNKAAAARKLGDEVVKVDDYTVQIKQSAPNPIFLPVLTVFGMAIWDKETMQAHATKADPWSHTWAATTNYPSFGPYCLERWVKDSEFVVRANPKYYRGKPAIDRIVYRKVPSSSNRVAAILTSSAQLVEHLTPKEYSTLRNVKDVKVAGVFGNTNTMIQMNWKSKPFDNILVRQAVAYAMPYDEVIRVGYLGQARRWRGQIPSTYPGFHLSKTQYDTNVAKAKALLAKAGYPNGKGLSKYASSFQLTYIAEKEDTLGPIATVIRSALQQAGFPVQLNPIPQTQWADRVFVKRDVPFALNDAEKPIAVDAGYAANIDFLSVAKGGVANNINYNNPTVDSLIERSNVEPNQAKRFKLLAQVQDIVQKQVVWLPIAEWKYQWAFSPNITGVTWHPSQSLEWFNLAVKK